MADIETMRHYLPAHLERDMAAADNGTLQAQELVQKGAIHALLHLQAIGPSPENVAAMLESLQRLGRIVTAEVRRRGLAEVHVDKQPPGRPSERQ